MAPLADSSGVAGLAAKTVPVASDYPSVHRESGRAVPAIGTIGEHEGAAPGRRLDAARRVHDEANRLARWSSVYINGVAETWRCRFELPTRRLAEAGRPIRAGLALPQLTGRVRHRVA
jgi:hypothetical protein